MTKEAGHRVHSPDITFHVWNSLELPPCSRVFRDQQKDWENTAANRDLLQKAILPEPIVVPAKAVVLKENRKWRNSRRFLAEKCVVGCYTVCAKEEDRETARPMVVVEFPVSFQNFEEAERSGGDGSETIAALRDLTGVEVRSPALRNEVGLPELKPGQGVVSLKAMEGMSKFRFESGLCYAAVRVYKTMRAVG